jgi:nucleoside-diphosphate-sugar epimerase
MAATTEASCPPTSRVPVTTITRRIPTSFPPRRGPFSRPCKPAPNPCKPDGTPRKLVDLSRLKALGREASIGLEEGLRDAYGWSMAQGASGAEG